MGVAATSDPLVKLQDAQVLFMVRDRPLPAEMLIQEAIAILQKRRDWQFLGHAFREYGELLESDAVARMEKIYRRDGFRDRSISFDTRRKTAAEYYQMAMDAYKKAELPNLQASQYDALTNLYFNMGLSSHYLGLDTDACLYYAKMIDAAGKNRELHPSIAPPILELEKTTSSAKQAAGCGAMPPN